MEQQEPKIQRGEIACQQVLEKGHAVFSSQWVVIPPQQGCAMTSDRLLQSYLAHIRSFTLTLVRPVVTAEGVVFRLLHSTIPLLKFSPPLHEAIPRGTRTTLRIAGGVLVQPHQCARGELEFRIEQVADGVKLTLQLADYCPLLLGSTRPPLWRKWLYRLTQARIHQVVTVRFLARVYRKIAGHAPKTRVVKVTLRHGEET